MGYEEKLNLIINNTFDQKKTEDCVNKDEKPEVVKQKLLLIDDDQILHDMYSKKFQINGYEVRAASSGEEAINLIKNGFVPDVLITDLMIPIMDGFMILDVINKENLAPKAVKIMLTNKGTTTEINRAKELGVNGFIVKAATIPSEVVEEVKKICNDFYNC